MPDSKSKISYDARTAYKVGIKLNRHTDTDLVSMLEKAGNKQLLIKEALRAYIGKEKDMATTYVFDRESCYGEAEFLGDLDPNGDYTEEQVARVRDLFVEKVSALVEQYDPTLSWWPSLSEVWGVVGKTEADRAEFHDWWKSGASGAFEDALIDAYAEIDKEGE